MKKILYFGYGLFFLLASYSFLLIVSPDHANSLTDEDGLIQTIGAICFSLASIITIYLYFKSKSQNKPFFLKTKRNIFYLFLAIYFFICFGEEISWGQRQLNIETPETLIKNNAQKELNVHNLWIFQSYDNDLSPKTGFKKWITSAKIFAYIWLLYCVIIPIINEYSSRIRNTFRKFYFPVIPLWIGILFPLNHVISRVFENMDRIKNQLLFESVIETKETLFAFLFLMASISLYYLYKLSRKETLAK